MLAVGVFSFQGTSARYSAAKVEPLNCKGPIFSFETMPNPYNSIKEAGR
jgi:hypothetical protein